MGYNKSLRHNNGPSSPANKSGKGVSSSRGSAVQWCNVTLTTQQKAALREQELDPGRFCDSLAVLLEAGHKVVLSPKNDRGFFSATVLGHTAECPNAGAGLSGEGGSFERSVLSLLLKLDILDGILTGSPDGPDDDFR